MGLDDSGILSVTAIESVFEKTVSPEEQEKLDGEEIKIDGEAIDWSKLGDTFSNFFGSDPNIKIPKEGEEVKEEEKDPKEKEKKTEKKEKGAKKDDKKEPKKPKIETVKTELKSESSRNDIELLDGDTFEAAKSKLDALNKADQDRAAREGALNELQSLSFDLQEKMYEEEYETASTEAEREKIRSESSLVSEWLDEEAGVDSPLADFTSRLKTLKDLMAPIAARVKEHKYRPEALEKLEQVFNTSNNFLEKSKEKVGEDGWFKEKELEALAKKIKEVKKWRDEKIAEQDAAPRSEMPKLTVSMINSKIHDLESEVQFLIQKAKMVKAEQERAKRKVEAEAKKAEDDKKKAEKKAKKAAKKNESESADEAKDEEPVKEEPEGSKEDTADKKPKEEEGVDSGSTSEDSRVESDKQMEDDEKLTDHVEL